MSIESEAFSEVFGLVETWTRRNQEVFPSEVRKRRIGVTDSLVGSFDGNTAAAGFMITSSQSFDDSGRFVDMGVGRGHAIEDRAGKAALMDEISGKAKSTRKPKKWYRIFFARLNALEGAVGLKVMEKGVEAVKGVKG